MLFPTDYQEIIHRMQAINPDRYGRTRNFIDGQVTYLSPYISRGVISTKQVMDSVRAKEFAFSDVEKFIQELTWRDYWQQVWLAKGDRINNDLKHPQTDVAHFEMPSAIVEGNTGILAIDHAINEFYKTGYLHNHLRMYIASIACNVGKSHWLTPARWMYYHLLDGDWASNALSWQWVAGSNSSKKYYANQENINRHCHTHQQDTFLDVDYTLFDKLAIPEALHAIQNPSLSTNLPARVKVTLDSSLPTLIYNYYNLDPRWHADEPANRILLLEPSHFEKYHVSENALRFALTLSKNIGGIQIFVGEFEELVKTHNPSRIYFKEHPFARHYAGVREERDWIFDVKGYYPSFFAFWKKCRTQAMDLMNSEQPQS